MALKADRKNFSSITRTDTLPQDELDSNSAEEDTAGVTSSFNDKSVTIGLLVFFSLCSCFLFAYIVARVLAKRRKARQLRRKNAPPEASLDSAPYESVFSTETSATTRRRRVPSRDEPCLSLTDETKFEEVVVSPHYSGYGQEGASARPGSGLLTREHDNLSFSSGEEFQLQQQQQQQQQQQELQQQQKQKQHGEKIVVRVDVHSTDNSQVHSTDNSQVHSTDNSQVGSVRPVIPLARPTGYLPMSSSSTTSLPSYLTTSSGRGAAHASSTQSLPSRVAHDRQPQRSGSVSGRISSSSSSSSSSTRPPAQQAGEQQPGGDLGKWRKETSLLMTEEDVNALEQGLSPWKPI